MGADHTIDVNDYGLYEQTLQPNTAYVVDLTLRNGITPSPLEIINLGADPIYIRTGNTVTVRDTQARVVLPGGYITFTPAAGDGTKTTIALISINANSFSITLP